MKILPHRVNFADINSPEEMGIKQDILRKNPLADRD